MSSNEFAEWQAYYNHDPFGGFRSDLQAAIVARTVAAVFAGERAPSTFEFLPTFWKPEEEDEPEESPESLLQGKINTIMAAFGGVQSTGSVLEPKPPTKEA